MTLPPRREKEFCVRRWQEGGTREGIAGRRGWVGCRRHDVKEVLEERKRHEVQWWLCAESEREGGMMVAALGAAIPTRVKRRT